MKKEQMKFLPHAGILGFSYWMIAAFMVIFKGEHAPVYFFTAGYHFFAGIGIWGLYRAQKQGENTLGKIGAVRSALAYLGLVYVPIAGSQTGVHLPALSAPQAGVTPEAVVPDLASSIAASTQP